MKKIVACFFMSFFVSVAGASVSRELKVFTAIEEERINVLEQMIKKESWQVIAVLQDVKCLRHFFGFNPLHAAIKKKSKKVLDILLQAEDCDLRVALTQQDCRGLTPLNYAVKKNLFDCAKALLEAGANPNISDNEWHAPLHYAVQNGNVAMVDLLLEHDARIDAKVFTVDNKELEPVHFIFDERLTPHLSEELRLKLIQSLVIAGLDVNKSYGFDDETLLHWAVEKNYKDIIIFLIKDLDVLIKESSESGKHPFSDFTHEQIVDIFGDEVGALISNKMPKKNQKSISFKTGLLAGAGIILCAELLMFYVYHR